MVKGLHDSSGKFAVGHPPIGGRKSKDAEKAEAKAYLDAIRSVMTPEGLTAYLQRAAKIAEENKSSKGMVQVATMIAEYSVGKPKQQIEVSTASDLLALLESDDRPLLPVDAEVEVKRLE